ncbi:hypothetical protein Rhopal_001598-T1 [Rhodotorula paludigena]|uniref:RlpA-like protein double-psi beta-barrel domain-containing protein n=1 Tax=Rhodotorula paludigena TaxID=86838 RepID=A0AAV5GGZ7_9BASI|nr:hypothetical protein Rhopal_001598-T1 [Rhodotorula paludigena]
MLAAAFTALAALAAVNAAPVALNIAEASVSLPNTTETATAYYYYQNDHAGACGWVSQDSDLVVGLPLEYYGDYAVINPYCGAFVVVEGQNKTVTALVADASTLNETLTLSIGAWNALDGDNGLETVSWRFANETETAAAKNALSGSSAPSSAAAKTSSAAVTTSSAATTTSSAAPATSSSAAPVQKEATTSAAAVEEKPSSTSTWSPEPKTTTTSTQEWKPTTTTSTKEWKPTTTSTQEWKPTTTSKWVAPTTTTTQAAPKTTQAQTDSSASSAQFSGRGTYYFQNGAAGSCGNYNSDSAYIIAVSASQMNSGLCGKKVSIRNTSNGKSITATVADTCPGCGYGSIDLSEGAFGALGEYSQGVLPLAWSFI